MSFYETIVDAIEEGKNPREMLKSLFNIDPDSVVPSTSPESDVWRVLLQLASVISRQSVSRPRTPINEFDKVVDLLRNAKNIVVVIGAGASIGPDFRSPGGLYDQIEKDGSLENPYEVFDLDYFQKDPSVFWKYAHLIYPDVNPQHSEAHYFIQRLQDQGKLLRLYSQNVDVLEVGVPDEKLRCVHGSWRESNCLQCNAKYTIEDIRPFVESQTIPICKACGGQIKPGIVFFGQKTNIEDEDIQYDSEHGDLLVVIGTSLRVAPVSYIPRFMSNVPSILINREPVTCEFNAELLGDCTSVVHMLEHHLGWREDGDDQINFVEPNKFLIGENTTKFFSDSRSTFQVTPVSSIGDADFD